MDLYFISESAFFVSAHLVDSLARYHMPFVWKPWDIKWLKGVCLTRIERQPKLESFFLLS